MAHHTREFESSFFLAIQDHLSMSDPVRTLGQGRPNWVVAVEPRGLLVETERSRSSAAGPQLVPAWMFDVAWQRLTSRGRLANAELLSSADLNVKRSSFVCAVLAQLPGVEVASTRPIVLAHVPDA